MAIWVSIVCKNVHTFFHSTKSCGRSAFVLLFLTVRLLTVPSFQTHYRGSKVLALSKLGPGPNGYVPFFIPGVVMFPKYQDYPYKNTL